MILVEAGVGEFVDTPEMTIAPEGGRQEGGDARLGHVRPDQPRTQRDGVGVIVAARETMFSDAMSSIWVCSR